jgi:hypothetical protein
MCTLALTGEYPNLEALAADVRRVFANCASFHLGRPKTQHLINYAQYLRLVSTFVGTHVMPCRREFDLGLLELRHALEVKLPLCPALMSVVQVKVAKVWGKKGVAALAVAPRNEQERKALIGINGATPTGKAERHRVRC